MKENGATTLTGGLAGLPHRTVVVAAARSASATGCELDGVGRAEDT